jgi:hypothetical protein
MHDSLAYVAGGPEVPHRAFGYSEVDGRWQQTDQSSTSAVLDDGGIYATLEDLARWDAALYDDRLPCVGPSRIVQDADRLDKLGALGVGSFFTKASLRGRGLVEALAQALSRELTYALAAPRSMFTRSGRELARTRSARSIAYFESLLAELEESGIASFEPRPLLLRGDFRSRDGVPAQELEVTVVTPRACPECGGELSLAHRLDRGVKCETLKARCTCAACAWGRDISFCLPVLA